MLYNRPPFSPTLACSDVRKENTLRFGKRLSTTPREKRGTRRAVVALFLLAPLCGELLSGSTTPIEWLNPFSVLLLAMLYGSGALLIREFVRRWGKGWPSILLLGAAYGIYEEGIVVRSFFDPTWGDLDILAWYGRWLGVNWVWSLNLTLFHMVVSITIPILLVELMYPELRDRLWLTRRGLKIHGLLFASMAIIGIAFEMHAPPLGYVGCALAMLLLARLARRWPDPDPAARAVERLPRPRRVALFGSLMMVGLLITMWVIPNLEPPALVAVLAGGALPVVAIGRARRLGVWAWTPRHQWAFATGALSLWIALALIAAAGPDMPLGGLAFAVFLWWLGRRIGRRDVPRPTPDQLIPPPVPVPASS